MVTEGTKQDVWWWKDCENNGIFHQWHAPIGKRTRILEPQGCAICHGKQVQIGVNDLASQSPNIAEEWHPTLKGEITPEMFTNSSSVKVWWNCLIPTCSYEWPAAISTRTMREGNNCPECSDSRGFDNEKPATLYVICDEINRYRIVQFGISNKVNVRLKKHYLSGFISAPIALISFEKGKEARTIETSIKRLMRSHGVLNCNKLGIKFDGSTEAFRMVDATQEFKTSFEQLLG